MKITVVQNHERGADHAAGSSVWPVHQVDGQCGCEECAVGDLSYCVFCSGNCASRNSVVPAADADGRRGRDELRPPLS